jgi:hypothetical protein
MLGSSKQWRMIMDYEQAERFLKDHYTADELFADLVRKDNEHWERVAGDPVKFPKANLEFIDKFGEAATIWLALQ